MRAFLDTTIQALNTDDLERFCQLWHWIYTKGLRPFAIGLIRDAGPFYSFGCLAKQVATDVLKQLGFPEGLVFARGGRLY